MKSETNIILKRIYQFKGGAKFEAKIEFRVLWSVLKI